MKKSRVGILRAIIQWGTLIIVFVAGLNNFLADEGSEIAFLPSSSNHNLCPFGGVSTLYSLFTSGDFISKIHSSAVVVLVLVLIITLLFGAIFCGFFCPFGTVQELVGKLGKKLFPKKFNHFLPAKADTVLRFVRYLVLGKLVYETAVVGKLICEQHDPYYAMMSFFNGEILPAAFILLTITIMLSLFVERPFCKYFCPLGAVLGLVGRFAIFKPRRNAKTCIGCKKCDSVCPMNIPVSSKKAAVGHHCISCYQCVSGQACPVENTLTISTKSSDEKEAAHEA